MAETNKYRLLFATVFLGLVAFVVIHWQKNVPTRFAYVETSRIMKGYKLAISIENDLKRKNEEWQADLAIIRDSLKAAMDTMSKYFDHSSPTRKKELQLNLATWEQRAEKFREANQERMTQLRREKRVEISAEVNRFLQSYGKENGWSIIWGTVPGGNIVYGDSAYDITDEVLRGLNARQ